MIVPVVGQRDAGALFIDGVYTRPPPQPDDNDAMWTKTSKTLRRYFRVSSSTATETGQDDDKLEPMASNDTQAHIMACPQLRLTDKQIYFSHEVDWKITRLQLGLDSEKAVYTIYDDTL